MDFNSLVQFSSNWILVLACATLWTMLLFLVLNAAFIPQSGKKNRNTFYLIAYLVLMTSYSAFNMAGILTHTISGKEPGLLSVLIYDLPFIAMFFYFKTIESFSGTPKRFLSPAAIVLIALALFYPFHKVLPQQWNVLLNVFVMAGLLFSPGVAFYYHSTHVDKTKSGNLLLYAQMIAVAIFTLTLVNDFALNSFEFVIIPDNIQIAGFAVLGILLTTLFFKDLRIPLMEKETTQDPANRELSGFLDDIRRQYELSLEISRETGDAAEKLFALIRDFVNDCSDSIGRIQGMDTKMKNNVNDIKQKLSEFIDKMLPVMEGKKKTEKSGQTVDEIRNILEEIENKGKIVSSGVVNLTSVIDSAKKNTEKSHQIILDIRTDMDNIESFSQTIESIAGEANVLAMNAAIESANHTDAATNGFRVVSDDLRDLSSKIKGQTSEIQNVLTFLLQDLETGIRSTQNVRTFFQDIELIIENIFRLILNIVNHSGIISNTVDDTRQNITSLQTISSRMEELVGNNNGLTVELNREVEVTRANFYQIGMLINKGKEVFDGMAESLDANGEKLSRLKAGRQKLERALIELSEIRGNS